MEIDIAETSFKDKLSTYPAPSLHRALLNYTFLLLLSVVFELHISPAIWLFSFTVNSAGAALKGPKREEAHTRYLST